MLTDDSDNSTPEPNVFGCTFNSDSLLTVTEPNESSESSMLARGRSKIMY